MGWTVLLMLAACGEAATPPELAGSEPSASVDPLSDARERLVRRTMEAPTDGRPPISDPRVLTAMRSVERHRFVPVGLRGAAYADRPLEIGHEQTISQPYIVALMTELAGPDPGERFLEVGTGSGYQAAVLAQLVQHVYTIEIVEPLARRAARDLQLAGVANVTVRAGDGYQGWPEHAPFDGIVVTAAPDHIPQPLVDQLAVGGRLVIPVGPAGAVQELLVLEKGPAGEIRRRTVLPVAFVPLTGDGAQGR